MTTCILCRKAWRNGSLNIDSDLLNFGYKVVGKVGKRSYKCVCNRCGYIWRTTSEDAAFQFNNPEIHAQRQRVLLKAFKRLLRDRQNGYSIWIYPKSTKYILSERTQRKDDDGNLFNNIDKET